MFEQMFRAATRYGARILFCGAVLVFLGRTTEIVFWLLHTDLNPETGVMQYSLQTPYAPKWQVIGEITGMILSPLYLLLGALIVNHLDQWAAERKSATH